MMQEISLSNFFEIISYDLFVTGIGFSIASSLTYIGGGQLTAELGAVGSGLALGGLFFWRLSDSVRRRE